MTSTMDFAAELRALASTSGLASEEFEFDGPPRCMTCRGPEVKRIADQCHECTAKRIDGEHADAIHRAWASVPASLRWANLNDPQIHEWVKDSRAVEAARKLAADFTEKPFIALVGDAGSGKTTLACALLREWVRKGARKDSTSQERYVARRARFSVAPGIVSDCERTALGGHVASLDVAREAQVLVLDEVGRGNDFRQVIFNLLHERHRENRPTILTTPFKTATELSGATRDTGLARRVFGDSVVIQVGS